MKKETKWIAGIVILAVVLFVYKDKIFNGGTANGIKPTGDPTASAIGNCNQPHCSGCSRPGCSDAVCQDIGGSGSSFDSGIGEYGGCVGMDSPMGTINPPRTHAPTRQFRF